MSLFSQLPAVGAIVIIVILILFVMAAAILFVTYARYKSIASSIGGKAKAENEFLRYAVNEFADAYEIHGMDTNTPAVISDTINSKLSGMLLCERFLNNAVSLFVTLGLFGTFLGLSLSVSSLTELISFTNTSEWLSVLDSVGGGLMSALSGMGVAFYTSLVGVACSILLTVLRSIFSPSAQREKLEAKLELWLDHEVAPTLKTERTKDDSELIHQMIRALDAAAESMDGTLKQATDDLRRTLEASRVPITAFNKTVGEFNSGVRDFSEFNYNLRGTVERMDVTVRDLVGGLREVSRSIEKGGRS